MVQTVDPLEHEGNERIDMKTTLRSELTCPSCIQKIKRQVSQVPDVSNVVVHFATGRIEVDHADRPDIASDLLAAVRKAGYEAEVSL